MPDDAFVPDHRHLVAAARNRRPERLPFYEHAIAPTVMERITGDRFADALVDDPDHFFRNYCGFFRDMGYDCVSFEVCMTTLLPEHGAIMGRKPGPVQDRASCAAYPWDELPGLFWREAEPQLAAVRRWLPAGMKLVGGVGNGPFELAEDLVGFEHLAYMQVDDPELFAEVHARIARLLEAAWTRLLERDGDLFAVCRQGDDWGFKTGPLMDPVVARAHLLPTLARVVELVHARGLPFLWHSCGNIFVLMEDAIAAGIDAKHSNEDAIASYDEWIARYGDRIGLFGGIDVDVLCRDDPAAVRDAVFERGRRYRARARGWALGSGNSIPDYVPAEGYLAMLEAGRRLRAAEG